MSIKVASPSEDHAAAGVSSDVIPRPADDRYGAEAGVALAQPPTANLRVLIIEDSPIVRGRLVRLVAGVPGVTVEGMAVDGTHALALIREVQPDVVILDIQLPGLNGIELLERLRAEGARCKVIILTTYAFQEFRRKSLDLGAEFFFDKAMEFNRVVEVLKNMVRRKQTQSQESGGDRE